MREPYREILVVDLLGGIGDLIMLLPVVHGLARRNPGGSLRVLTHEPGAALLRGDPAVTRVLTPRHGGAGAEREAVAEALAARRPDLAVTTTRYDGIPDLLAASGARCVTDLWRRPPPDEPVGERYLRILLAEGLLRPEDALARPAVRLTPAEIAYGESTLACRLPASGTGPPVVLITDAGMDVKRWPDGRWRELAASLARRGHPLPHPRPRRPSAARWTRYSARRWPRCRGAACAGSPRASPQWRVAAGWSWAATPGRCGWPPRPGRPPSGCSGPPGPAGTASAPGMGWAPPTCRGFRAARTAGPRPSPSSRAGGRPNARCPRRAPPAWPTSPWRPSCAP
nr:hypothetical protein [Microbispora sp. GKU 823]